MLYLALHLFFNALGPVIISLWGQSINHDILILISSASAVSAFHLLNAGKNKATYRQVFSRPELRNGVAIVMLTTAFMWTFGFLIPIYYSPFIFIFTYLGWPGFFGALVRYRQTQNKVYLAQLVLIGLILSGFYLQLFASYSIAKAAIGFVATLLTGFSLYLYLRTSRKLNLRGMSSSQILALRYILLLLFPLTMVSIRHEFHFINPTVIGQCLFIGLLTLVIPLYFGQLCIEKFGSENFSLLMGFTPFITYLFQFIFLGSAIISNVIVAFGLAIAIALPFMLLRLKRSRVLLA